MAFGGGGEGAGAEEAAATAAEEEAERRERERRRLKAMMVVEGRQWRSEISTERLGAATHICRIDNGYFTY